MTPIVGKLYKTNAGEVVRIVKENKGLGWPFVASDGEHYDHEGRGYHGSHFDLKEEVTV
jgi:hypothetical protein